MISGIKELSPIRYFLLMGYLRLDNPELKSTCDKDTSGSGPENLVPVQRVVGTQEDRHA